MERRNKKSAENQHGILLSLWSLLLPGCWCQSPALTWCFLCSLQDTATAGSSRSCSEVITGSPCSSLSPRRERIWLGWLGWGSTLSLFSQGQDTGHMACVHPIGRMEARSPRRRSQFFLPQWKWCPVPISGKPCTSWRAFLGSFTPVTSALPPVSCLYHHFYRPVSHLRFSLCTIFF